MLGALQTALAPEIELPGLFGMQVVHPVWIVGVWIGSLFSVLLLDSILSRLVATVKHYTGVDPILKNRAPADEPTDGPRFTIEELEARLASERRRWRDDARWAVKSVLIAPIVE